MKTEQKLQQLCRAVTLIGRDQTSEKHFECSYIYLIKLMTTNSYLREKYFKGLLLTAVLLPVTFLSMIVVVVIDVSVVDKS